MIRLKVLVELKLSMVHFTKEFSVKTNSMDMEELFMMIQKQNYTKGTLQTVKEMGMGLLYIVMAKRNQEFGKMVSI